MLMPGGKSLAATLTACFTVVSVQVHLRVFQHTCLGHDV